MKGIWEETILKGSELKTPTRRSITQQILRIILTLNLPTTTIIPQPFNVIKWQLKFNPVA